MLPFSYEEFTSTFAENPVDTRNLSDNQLATLLSSESEIITVFSESVKLPFETTNDWGFGIKEMGATPTEVFLESQTVVTPISKQAQKKDKTPPERPFNHSQY